ncbi:MAG: hypothetical protein A2W08_02265 [Candidatus Rokubacteria bacterium RBG_16_73_20]|nr:MAG: hypothetical protein A2050_02700 [Candidatus Rokubacteria bacterium GWA2_73_35]OGK84690.1 MAG: hypothetical protein A2X52_11300 [Candidatus Rokubacteria bacterium GWC2_70_16]OGK97820.1 MAG: hypothetical protein A2W08_02265 [Candidatus Rokubacteria bacterium RBG_16_73_20]HBH02835.1 hypothetical protein [Candidatus Rokubacteria bacterium]
MIPAPQELGTPARGGLSDTVTAFKDGVRFRCTRCGACCASLGRDLPLLIDDVRRLARHLSMTVPAFVRRYCVYTVDVVRDGDRTIRIPSLHLRVPPSGRCVFLADSNECSVQDVKPFICANSPFMRYVAVSRERWHAAVSMCPGIGIGRFHSGRAIERLLRQDDAAERRDVGRILAAGGSLARVLGVRLTKPVIRRTIRRTNARRSSPRVACR